VSQRDAGPSVNVQWLMADVRFACDILFISFHAQRVRYGHEPQINISWREQSRPPRRSQRHAGGRRHSARSFFAELISLEIAIRSIWSAGKEVSKD